MLVSGGGGGGGTVTVNPEAALEAAKGFETEGAAMDNARTRVDALDGDLSGWDGQAAHAAKDTIKIVSQCMTELSSGIMAHASLVSSAVQTFSEADDAAASAMQP